MGNSQQTYRCLQSGDIIAMLDEKRMLLTEQEAASLYRQFDFVIAQLQGHNHKECLHQRKCQNMLDKSTGLITVCKTIGYYAGKIIAFRIDKDPIPYLLFEHNNHRYKSAVKILGEF